MPKIQTEPETLPNGDVWPKELICQSWRTDNGRDLNVTIAKCKDGRAFIRFSGQHEWLEIKPEE